VQVHTWFGALFCPDAPASFRLIHLLGDSALLSSMTLQMAESSVPGDLIMPRTTLLHTCPRFTLGNVCRSTHPDFVLRQLVEVSWPLMPATGPDIAVILSIGARRYLAHWTPTAEAIPVERSYTPILRLPATRRL
jgi:hypothetical protein